MGLDPVPDAGQRGLCHDHRRAHRARRRRGAGFSGGLALGLQMVSQRAADRAYRHRGARRRNRHHGGAAAAQLGHRPLFLALGLRCARHCRPRLVGGVVRARPRRPADGRRRCHRPGNVQGAGARPDRLPRAVAQPDDPGLLGRQFRRLLGPLAGAVVAGRVSDQGARARAGLDRPAGRAAGRRLCRRRLCRRLGIRSAC